MKKKKNTKINILDTYRLHAYVDRNMWENVYTICTNVYVVNSGCIRIGFTEKIVWCTPPRQQTFYLTVSFKQFTNMLVESWRKKQLTSETIYIYTFSFFCILCENEKDIRCRTVPVTSSFPKMNSTFPSLAVRSRKTVALVSFSLLAASLWRRQLPDFIYFFWFRVSVLCCFFPANIFFSHGPRNLNFFRNISKTE